MVGATVEECRQQLLQLLKSGEYALSCADKEGYRTLCCYRQAYLFVAVGDEGTSVLRLPHDEALLTHLEQQIGGKYVPENGSLRWTYELTAAEKLERWQALQARLTPFAESGRGFVARALRELAEILGVP
ncbi:hypothetical protein GCM10022406_24190 [Hymenobacter algoricola]|uniref:DUF4304 domain-containing protein n=2 Tax=Hymenobacter algoricola TaxID=486267 RepID=A0ABP7N7G0_9BACT